MKIPSLSSVSFTPAALRSHLARSNTPLLLRGLTAAWPKTASWTTEVDENGKPTLDGLRAFVGDDTAVEVELGPKGRGYLDADWQRVNMGFGLFLDAFVLRRIPASDPSSLPTGYLAQAGLLDSCNALTHAVPEIAHYRSGPAGDVYRRTLWVGPERTFTPFHRDPNIGIYTHLVGSKVFHLLPPEAGGFMRPSTGVHANTSTIPVAVSRFERGEVGDVPPKVFEACRADLDAAFDMPGACVADLAAGDSVLIPQGWWHSAEGGDGVGVGINAWFR